MREEQEILEAVKKYGIAKIARRSGLHYNTIRKWVINKTSPSIANYQKIIDAVEYYEEGRYRKESER